MKNETEKAKPRILFVCSHMGGRSRIAQEFARKIAGDRAEVFSAALTQEKIGAIAVQIMAEVGVELPTEPALSVFERFRRRETFDYVVTLCKEAEEECPIFKLNIDTLYSRTAKHFSWEIPDFKSLTGSAEDKLDQAREIRDQLQSKVAELLSQIGLCVTA